MVELPVNVCVWLGIWLVVRVTADAPPVFSTVLKLLSDVLIPTGTLPLPQAVNMATLNPAKAVRVADHLGSIQPGKCADLILVSKKGKIPVVLSTFINGEEVTRLHYRNDFVGKDGARYD